MTTPGLRKMLEVSLTPAEKTSWNLVHRQGMKHAAAGELLGVSRVTICRRISRARAKINRLRLMLAQVGGDATELDKLTGLSRGEGPN